MRRSFVPLALLVAACAPAAQKKPDNRAPSSVEPDSVKLLDAGAEPRARLRYRFTAKQRDSVRTGLVLKLQASNALGADLSIGLDKQVTVESLLADGSAKVRIAVEKGEFFGRDQHGEGSFDFEGIA